MSDPVRLQTPAAGLNSSAEDATDCPKDIGSPKIEEGTDPPATRTCPFVSVVNVVKERGLFNAPVAVQLILARLKTSALAVGTLPDVNSPAASTPPLWRVARNV